MISLAFIIDRGLALRRNVILPPPVVDSLDLCETRSDVNTLLRFCQQHERAPLARLTTTAIEHLDWTKPDNVEALQTRARHEVSRMERGMVVQAIQLEEKLGGKSGHFLREDSVSEKPTHPEGPAASD